jgi:phytoene dehydrogenase-like protein
LIEQGKAVGVRLSDGEEISAGQLVASTVDPRTLVVDLLGKAVVGELMTRKIERYEWGDSIMVIYLALNGPLEFKAGEETAHACYVRCTPPSLEYIAQMFVEVRAGLLLALPVMVVCKDYTVDPSRVPPGKGLIKILVKCVPYEIRGDAKGEIVAQNWKAASEPYADRVIDLLEEHYIANLRSRILKRIDVWNWCSVVAQLGNGSHGARLIGNERALQFGAVHSGTDHALSAGPLVTLGRAFRLCRVAMPRG